MKKSDICAECGKECEIKCAAFDYLVKIYEETRTKEKWQLIRYLRKYIGFGDAETSKEMADLAKQIIRKVPALSIIKDFGIKVGYVQSYERKTKDGHPLFGECRKVNKTYSAYLPFDFIITFYEMNIGHLSDNQIKLLMLHELSHIGVGDRGLIIVPHDIEDFLAITDVHSTRWSEFGAGVINILE